MFPVFVVLWLAACGDAPRSSADPQIKPIMQISGSGNEYGRALAIDSEGRIVIAGHGNSRDLRTVNALLAKDERGEINDYDLIVLKQQAEQAGAISLRLGGDGDDRAFAVAVGPNDRIYLAGTTTSRRFPGSNVESEMPAGSNAFIAVLSSDLKQVVAARIIGGAGHDFARSLFVDTHGHVYLAGATASDDFPLTQEGFQATAAVCIDGNYNIGLDAYVLKLSPDLSRIEASARIGGAGDENVYAMAVDESFGVYLAGNTNSQDYPTTRQADDPTHNHSTDIFVTRFDMSLRQHLASTYAGWYQYDYARAMALDRDGSVYVAGHTHNTQDISIALPGAPQPRFAGGATDLLLLKYDPALSKRTAATFLGGSNDDYAGAIEVIHGDVYIAGYTASRQFPRWMTGVSRTGAGGYDMFAARLTPGLDKVEQVALVGGPGNDFAYALYPGAGPVLYLAGSSGSRTAGNGATGNMQLLGLMLTGPGARPEK